MPRNPTQSAHDLLARQSAHEILRNHPGYEPPWFPPDPVIGPPSARPAPPPPPDPWAKVKRWVWLGGVLWAVGAATAGIVGWVFGAGKAAANIPDKAYVDTQVAAEREVAKQHTAELQSVRERLSSIDTSQRNQEKTLDEIKATLKDLANRPTGGRR